MTLTLIAVIAFVLALYGARNDPLLSRINTAIRVFPLGLGTPPGQGESWALHLARALAWFVVAYAAVRATFILFGTRLDEFRARRAKGHVIVCGLGAKGSVLTASLLRDKKVVALELVPGPESQYLRDHGAIVLQRDATDPESLRSAGIAKAYSIAAVCGTDAVNAQIAATSLQLARSRAEGTLLSFAHIGDPRLYTFLLRHALGGDSAHMEFFNLYEQGARELLDAVPGMQSRARRAVLVVGAGDLGLAVVSLLARSRFTDAGEEGPAPIRIHLVALDASTKLELLEDRYTRLGDVCDLVAHDIDVSSPAFDHLLIESPQVAGVTAAFVCLDQESLAIATALNLLHQAQGRFPVVARVARRDSGLVALLESAGDREDDGASFEPLSLSETCRGDVVLEGMRGQLARGVHEAYRSGSPGGPYDVPWDELPAEGRTRNLNHADAIVSQLEAAGLVLAPLIDWSQPPTELNDVEIETMAEDEHERWMDERLEDGWRYGPLRDDATRTHPDLIPWESLPTERQDINRRLVSARPALLTEVGIGLYRT